MKKVISLGGVLIAIITILSGSPVLARQNPVQTKYSQDRFIGA